MKRSVCSFIAAGIYWLVTLTSMMLSAGIITWFPGGVAFAVVFGGYGVISAIGYNMPFDGTLSDGLANTIYELCKDEE